MPDRAREEAIEAALAKLRHLYSQMVDPEANRNPAGAAKGLLGPAIQDLERFAAALSMPAGMGADLESELRSIIGEDAYLALESWGSGSGWELQWKRNYPCQCGWSSMREVQGSTIADCLRQAIDWERENDRQQPTCPHDGTSLTKGAPHAR